MAKRDLKIYEIYRKNKSKWDTIIVGVLFAVAIGWALLSGTLKIENAGPVVIGEHPLTWFHWVMLVILFILLGFGIYAMIRDRSAEQQEIYRQQRIEAARLKEEVMAERREEAQAAYEAMKRRRAERLAAKEAAESAGEEQDA